MSARPSEVSHRNSKKSDSSAEPIISDDEEGIGNNPNANIMLSQRGEVHA